MKPRSALRLLTLVFALTVPAGTICAGEIPSPVRPVTGYDLFSVVGTRTLEAGRFSLGGELELVQSPDVTRASFLLAYGLTEDLEIGASFPYTAAEDQEAVGDLALTAKYLFFHEGRYGPALGVAGGLNLPTGQHNDDAVSGRIDLECMVVGTKRLGPFTGHMNLAYTLVGESDFKDEVTAAFAVEFAAARTLTILGELYSRSARVPNESDMLEWRVGYKVQAPGGIISKLGVGFPFGDRDPDYRVIFSLSWHPGLE